MAKTANAADQPEDLALLVFPAAGKAPLGEAAADQAEPPTLKIDQFAE
jgi:hypothetical protein